MISFDELNEELRQQQDRLSNFRVKAAKLHKELTDEVDQVPGFDLFQREVQDDTLHNVSTQLIKQDKKLRDYLKGPTIRREKFHSSYWRTWNEERELLENVSREELIKTTISQQGTKQLAMQELSPIPLSKSRKEFAGTLNTGLMYSTKSSPKKEGRKSKREYQTLKGDYIPKNWKSAVFASPTDLRNDPDNLKTFDKHLMGHHNSIQELAQQTAVPKIQLESSIFSPGKMDKTKKNESTWRSLSSKNLPSSGYDPTTIGNAPVKGGDMTMAPQRGKAEECLTKNCDIPNNADALKTVTGGPFGLERRFPPAPEPATNTGSSAALPAMTSSSSGFKFPIAPRFSKDKKTATNSTETNSNEGGDLLATPGPGQYTVPRLFDPTNSSLEKRKDFDEIYEKYRDDPPHFSLLPSSELSKLEVMGHLCDAQEHLRYGRCQHPLCCRRMESDKAMLRNPDHVRVVGYDTYNAIKDTPSFLSLTQRLSTVMPSTSQSVSSSSTPFDAAESSINESSSSLMLSPSTSSASRRRPATTAESSNHSQSQQRSSTTKTKRERRIEQETLMSNTLKTLLPKPLYSLSALYTAAYKNDVATIKRIAQFPDINPNEFNEENGYTALHIAVAQGNKEAVQEILLGWVGRGLDINLPDTVLGNTALHIACQKLNKEIVMILCQEESCNPRAFRNKRGEYPLDICFIQKMKHNNSMISHEIWQIITVTIQRNELKDEIELVHAVKQLKKKGLL